MTIPYPTVPKDLLEQAYLSGYAVYGDLNLSLDKFITHLLPIIRKHSQSDGEEEPVASLIGRLHTADLYLSAACALQSEKAWSRFDSAYRPYIYDLAALACVSIDMAYELAGDILPDMFLPDRSGKSRIASYDGQASLRTWLRVIVIRRAMNERGRKWRSFERLDSVSEVADEIWLKGREAEVRGDKYDHVITSALKNAVERLSERERLLLVLHYEDSMPSVDIARFVGVHPSTVSRKLQQIYLKLRSETTAYLSTNCKLTAKAIEECEEDIVKNPAHSIMSFVLAQ
jgi:RNA polymerase sigma-70 factor